MRGARIRKVLDDKKVRKMKASTRKAWSVRSLRWMTQMPEELVGKDIALHSTKTELKKWIRGSVHVKGDRILWGKKLTGEMERKRRGGEAGPEKDNGRDGNEDNTGEIHEEEEDIDVINGTEEREGPQDPIDDRVNTEVMRTGMKNKCRGCVKRGKTRSSGSSNRAGRGGWVPGYLPRAGVEPKHPGKGGSLSPIVRKGYATGQLLLMRCILFVTLISFMGLRNTEKTCRRLGMQQLQLKLVKNQESEEPRCGIG